MLLTLKMVASCQSRFIIKIFVIVCKTSVSVNLLAYVNNNLSPEMNDNGNAVAILTMKVSSYQIAYIS